MKTNAIQDKIKNMGFERGVQWVLESHNERLKTMQVNLTECADQLNRVMDQLTGLIQVAGAHDLKFKEMAHPELGENTMRIGDKEHGTQ